MRVKGSSEARREDKGQAHREALCAYLDDAGRHECDGTRLSICRERSPLQEFVGTGIGGRLCRARVVAGCDPGTFFCGGLLRHLTHLSMTRPYFVGGFIHIPPHRESFSGNGALPTRVELLDLTSLVLSRILKGIVGADTPYSKILLTGFGPFYPIRENPTELYCRDSTILKKTFGRAFGDNVITQRELADGVLSFCVEVRGGIGLFTDVFALGETNLDALEERYYQDMSTVRDRIARLESFYGGMDAIIGLGVDSQQCRMGGEPTFSIETQSRGFEWRGRRDQEYSVAPVRNLSLAMAWMEG